MVPRKRGVNTVSTIANPLRLIVFLQSSLLLSRLTLGRFYPQRASGQAVVTGRCLPLSPPPRYVPSFFVAHRVQHSFPPLVGFHRMQLTHSRSSRYPPNRFIVCQEKIPTIMRSARLEPKISILIGTRAPYQATEDAITGDKPLRHSKQQLAPKNGTDCSSSRPERKGV